MTIAAADPSAWLARTCACRTRPPDAGFEPRPETDVPPAPAGHRPSHTASHAW